MLIIELTTVPFTFHLNLGNVPPLVTEAKKHTLLPTHDGFEAAVTTTETGRDVFTTMVIALDVAGLLITQPARLEVKTQVTTSLFAGWY